MSLYSITLLARSNVGFTLVGEPISADTITFRIQGLAVDRTYQWLVKPTTTTPDADAIAGNFGTVTASTISISIPLPSGDYEVGSTYYFALREFDGSSSQEVIQVSFTIAQNAVLGSGTSILNIAPLYLPEFTTEDRDELDVTRSVLIYNTTTEQIEQYDPVTETWEDLGGGGDLDLKANKSGDTFTGNVTVQAEFQTRSSTNLGDNNGIIQKVENDGSGKGRLVWLFNNISSYPTVLTATRASDNTLERIAVSGKLSASEPVASTDVATKGYVDNAGSTTTAGNNPTINARKGYFTTATLTTAAGNNTSTVLTLTNNTILANDIVIVTFDQYSGAIGSNGVPTVICASSTAGSATINVRNTHPANPINGTLRIHFTILTP